ncbi:hypothetical protein Cgig2_028059 [Carnegiea gigantea]|uniref:Multiple myeloma tumor-associated protein 2-like N-terminal domain-containing protein n=1 Tax=Carnegiea gigantea TaxID=171969 RepID=A0A9Q1GJE7_9CARY|nr:hypothetical protein Cgig2_028059 [Carnegiea gigantea]
MYHPSRGGVRGGRDQFKWDDVKVDKHRENYLGHSIKAPVGRWQKGKDLFWYARDKNGQGTDQDALKAEIQKVKEEEEQLMREALGLAPKRSNRPQGNRLDKHEFSELVKRGSTAEDLGAGHAEAARVDGLGFSRAPCPWEASSSIEPSTRDASAEPAQEAPIGTAERVSREGSEESREKKRKHDERKREKREEKKRSKHEKRHSRDSDDKRERRKDKEKRRRNSD